MNRQQIGASALLVFLAALALAGAVLSQTPAPTRYCIWTRQRISGDGYSLVIGTRTYYVCCPPHKTTIQSWSGARQRRFADLWRSREELILRRIATDQAMDRVKAEGY